MPELVHSRQAELSLALSFKRLSQNPKKSMSRWGDVQGVLALPSSSIQLEGTSCKQGDGGNSLGSPLRGPSVLRWEEPEKHLASDFRGSGQTPAAPIKAPKFRAEQISTVTQSLVPHSQPRTLRAASREDAGVPLFGSCQLG